MKAVIFDFDGTLGDSMDYVAHSMTKQLEKYKVKYPDDLEIILTPLGYFGAKKYFVDEKWLTAEEAEICIEAAKAELVDDYRNTIPLKPFASQLVDQYKKQGMKVALLSASPHNMIDPCLARNGIIKQFDYIWSTEDFGLTKSQPELFYRVLDLLGTKPEETLFFDDNKGGLFTAAKCGIKTVGVYDKSSAPDRKIIEAITDRYIESFDEML